MIIEKGVKPISIYHKKQWFGKKYIHSGRWRLKENERNHHRELDQQ